MPNNQSTNKQAIAAFENMHKTANASSHVTDVTDHLEKYEDKVIAFLDLLGVTNQIKESAKDDQDESELIRKMKDIKATFARFFDGVESMQALYVSDSLICSCDIEHLTLAMENLATFQWTVLTEFRTLLRGAVEYGKVYVDDEGTQIIGPAYLDAYNRQEHDAIFPRVIIGETILTDIKDKDKIYESIKDKIFKSEDGESFIDYLEYRLQLNGRDEVKKQLCERGIYNYLTSNYDVYNKTPQLRIRSKYAWTINYIIEKGVWE